MLINKDTNRENTPVFKFAHRAGNLTNFSFDWRREISDDNAEVWRLSVASNKHTIAYISFTIDAGFIFINLMERENARESAKFGNIGATLISFACLRSLEEGFGGVVAFTAKNRLINWYQQEFNAQRMGNSNRMVILENEAQMLINQYLP